MLSLTSGADVVFNFSSAVLIVLMLSLTSQIYMRESISRPLLNSFASETVTFVSQILQNHSRINVQESISRALLGGFAGVISLIAFR